MRELPPEEREIIEGEIRALKSLLENTDYNSNKIIEGMVTSLKDVSEEDFTEKFIAWVRNAIIKFGEVVDLRAAWREKINELEQELEPETPDSENE